MQGSGLAPATSARSGSKLWLRPVDSPLAKNRRHSHDPRPAYGMPLCLETVPSADSRFRYLCPQRSEAGFFFALFAFFGCIFQYLIYN